MNRLSVLQPPLSIDPAQQENRNGARDFSTPSQHEAHKLTVVIPFYNEERNVLPLLDRVHFALKEFSLPWELIAIDDGSEDETLRALRNGVSIYGAHVRVIQLQRNFGQTAAMQAGIEAARGTLIATLDGDLQNDPADIPALTKKLLNDDLDLVIGWRQDRRDALLKRKIPSWIANRLIGRVTGVNLHDYGCTLKVYRAAIIKQVPLYGEMHRFIPAWLSTIVSPRRIAEMPVRHYPRQHGESKYGASRTIRVLLDLLSVYFFLRFNARPGHFFGLIGLVLGTLGSAILGWLAFVKFVLNEAIGGRPLLLAGVICVIASVQLLTTGVLAEMIIRVYYGATKRASYVVRNVSEAEGFPEQGWHSINP
ncbi:MAG: glycosyltransferase family 2 protein [Pseudomonadota bacterium]